MRADAALTRMTTPDLAGDGVYLRALARADEALYVQVHASPEAMRHVGDPLDVVTARSRFSRAIELASAADTTYRMWTVVVPGEEAGIGISLLMTTGPCAEIGIMLLPAWQRRGIGRRVLDAMVEYGFDRLGLPAIESRQRNGNMGWQRVMEQSGFKRIEGTPMPHEWLGWRRDQEMSVSVV
ncbi:MULTISPECIES: GNAT family N-acetyltransferase [unclassified Pseudoxanthomonas]|uniref:GNAT family N-acetyltransferase n=1 Tax=unclassified Pseudoxanthomonas TaxID=2645906 RepID=UPI0008ED1249|nr:MULTISPECIES: GNAT family N-acetyltransferase [unclassified Pseudoxanthomonas]PPJ42554.1 N-acetyltransferase [Pseudoxanthomonas sp. KAs_5_3]SFV26901.1 Protein N-acetyltransferase, RimJ/RimL family [Pseudoxanthomonas sp. YR558]